MRIKYIIFLNCILILSLTQNLYAQSLNQIYLNEVAKSDSLHSSVLKEQRKIWVQLPENYNPKSNQKYPVVYLLDGDSLMSALATVYENYWGHYLPNMILVGIANYNNRTRDLTTSEIKSRNGGPMNMETGGAEKFTAFIEKELIPYIDSNYPTTSYRTLIGHSYAGLFTINAMINYTHLFKNYIAIDPSLDWDNQKLLKQAKTKFKTENFKGVSLFVSLAAEQIHMQNEAITIDNVMQDTSGYSLFARSIVEFSEFAELQKQNELNFSWKVFPNDLHGTVPLPSMREGLVKLFDWYQFKHPPMYNNPETSLNTIKSLLVEQGDILTANFGYPTPPMIEELFLGYGMMFLQFEQLEKARHFFEQSIKYYPESDQGYGLLADYYEAKKDSANTLKYLFKAFLISGDEFYKERIDAIEAIKK